ncbi:MAG: diguanylate cyclase [Pseudomonadales bacterium RIFCSPLOWO2_12_59_9]|nr:MAG: diguanylate cyclase [Pseudomonadales bacterium RIFCSPLOWO2_12_59_9]
MLRLLRTPSCLLLICLCLLAGQSVAALPTFSANLEMLQQPLALQHIQLLEDPHASLSPSQALEQLQRHGQLRDGNLRLGYSGSAWWIGFALNTHTADPLSLIIDNPFTDDIQLWRVVNGQPVPAGHAGDLLPFSARREPYANFLLPLPALDAGHHEILLRIKSSAALSLPMSLVASASSKQLLSTSWLKSGLLCGALLIMALFHLAKYSTLREPQLGFYCATLFSATLYYSALLGPINLLWPLQPSLQTILLNLAGSATLIASTLFICSILALRGRRLRLLRNGFFALIVVCATPAVLGLNDFRQQQLINSLFLLNGLYQIGLCLYGVKLKRPLAKPLLMLWSAAFLVMITLPLSRMGLLPSLPVLSQVSFYLPAISFFLFGILSAKQLEQVRVDLFASQQQAIDNLERYQALFNNAAEGIVRCQRDGTILEANPGFLRLLGQLPQQTQNLRGQAIQSLLKTSDWTHLLEQLSPEQPTVSGECQVRDHRGNARWVYLSLYLLPAQEGIEGIVVDLSERHALELHLQNLAAHDSLTGLFNRREMERLLQAALNDPQAQYFSHLLYLDLDQFKQVNDLCGHSAGDQLLRQLATKLQHQLPAQAKLARIGGDEFVVLLEQQDGAAAMAQAEALRACVEQFVFSWQGRPFRLFVSIGLLELSTAVNDWETALNWADSACQRAKNQGRNRVHQFNPADGVLLEHQRQLQWITRLRAAIEHQHFELFFQPVMPLQQPETGWHYEVLLRYHDPQSGEWIAPGQFLGAAERYGLLGVIDRWVIRQLFDWMEQNPHHLRQLSQVNLNLSGSSLLDGEVHQLLKELLASHQLPAHKLCIEVTEMVALGELGVSSDWITKLREQGIKVALDDFGSGFASYAYLRHLPLDLLKIDGTFIHGLESDPINQAMVSSMQQIAQQLGLKTVAEFVENQATLDCLRGLGIDYAQGYFIDHPKPLETLADHDSAQLTLALSSPPLSR